MHDGIAFTRAGGKRSRSGGSARASLLDDETRGVEREVFSEENLPGARSSASSGSAGKKEKRAGKERKEDRKKKARADQEGEESPPAPAAAAAPAVGTASGGGGRWVHVPT